MYGLTGFSNIILPCFSTKAFTLLASSESSQGSCTSSLTGSRVTTPSLFSKRVPEAMGQLHATIEVVCRPGLYARRMLLSSLLRPIRWLPRGTDHRAASERLRRAECGGQLRSVKPWRLEDVLRKPLGRRG